MARKVRLTDILGSVEFPVSVQMLNDEQLAELTQELTSIRGIRRAHRTHMGLRDDEAGKDVLTLTVEIGHEDNMYRIRDDAKRTVYNFQERI